jgi:amidase
MKGSPFGWATEFAGSARIPAAFNNLFSLKVSSGRLPTLGVATVDTSLPSRNLTIAMITSNLALLTHVARLCLGARAFEEDCLWLDMPWREVKLRELSIRRPTFAILESDGTVRPQPPVSRALRSVAERLRRANYQVIEWKPPCHATVVQDYFKVIGADGASAQRQHIKASGEPPVPMLKDWYFNPPTPPLPLDEYLALIRLLEKRQLEYQHYWKSTGRSTSSGSPVDGVIMPVCANAACLENTLTYFGNGNGF